VSAFPESDPNATGLHGRWYEANRSAGALTAQHCECGEWRNPARHRCPGCGGEQWAFEPVSPTGVVESWTVTRRPLHFAFAEAVPYAIVVVSTPEGARFLLQFRGEAESVAIGDEVSFAVDRFGVPYAGPSAASVSG
jgi:uncharacterized OB-fold protein